MTYFTMIHKTLGLPHLTALTASDFLSSTAPQPRRAVLAPDDL